MIRATRIYSDDNLDPYRNIALEEYFFDTTPPGVCLLFLWQNRDTVVVGRNQNCWKECRVKELERDGGHLARRLSGGGAVFHDTGNLNFTFLVATADYDLQRQLDVVLRAVLSLGIWAERSGRNDLIVEGRKFSGNAFYFRNERAYHHGTILVSADTEKATAYLSVSPEKLRSKGVESVRSRIANLEEFRADLSVDEVRTALESSFEDVYGLVPRRIQNDDIDWDDVARRRERFASPDWKYNRDLPFQYLFSRRFPWGEIEFRLDVKNGYVADVEVLSDAMDEAFIRTVADSLRACAFSSRAMIDRLGLAFGDAARAKNATALGDVIALLDEQEF